MRNPFAPAAAVCGTGTLRLTALRAMADVVIGHNEEIGGVCDA